MASRMLAGQRSAVTSGLSDLELQGKRLADNIGDWHECQHNLAIRNAQLNERS
jgi:hypothetical protein